MQKVRKAFILGIILVLLLFNLQISNSKAIDVFGNNYQGSINPNETIALDFLNFNKKFNLTADINLNFNVTHFSPILIRQISVIVNNSDPIMLNISFNLSILNFIGHLPEDPTLGNLSLIFRYNSVMKIISNTTIEKVTFKFEQNVLYGINPELNYTIVYYKPGQSSWQVINTTKTINNNTADNFIEGSLTNIEKDEEYYITIYNISEEPPFTPQFPLILVFITVLVIVIIVLVIVISKQEYFEFLKNRISSRYKSHHRLSLEEILNNENRNKIIDLILENPGIHFNELLRKTELSPGNLVWHLDLLESYKIIGKRRFENYVIYYPYYKYNPISNIELTLKKSDLTLKVLEMIESEPGIWNSVITKKLKINRKTIEYHIKKLLELGIISREKDGSKNRLFPRQKYNYTDNENEDI
ncbi:MAG: winged helix-turn-helix transcriptional regulator [Candidatus Hodarchaeota archaeon]